MSSRLRIISRGGYPEKRRDKRRLKPTLVVTIDGAAYRTRDWSLGGLLLSGFRGRKVRGEEIEAELRAATATELHAVKTIVVRQIARQGQVALRFTELSDGAFALLEDLSTGRERRAAGLRRRHAPSQKP